MVIFHFLILILMSFPAFCENNKVANPKDTKIVEEKIEQNKEIDQNDDINEFKKKLFNEEELRKETNNVVEDDDFDVLLEEEQEEEKEQKKEKEEMKKDEENNKKEQNKEEDNNKEKKIETEAKDSKTIESEDNNKNTNKDKTSNTKENKEITKQDIINDIYNITDTGVSEEFLFSKEYKNIINNQTTIKKEGSNKESDIPILYVVEKNIVDFNTTEIPEEIMTIKRSEENKHIPTIVTTDDMQDIAKKAIIANDLAVLRGVIEQVQNPDFMIDLNRTAFVFCIENSKYTLVKYMIYSGVSINRQDNEGNTPLHIAIKNKDLKMVQLLLNSGADIDIGNNIKDTPLLYSLKHSDDRISIFLLKFGADINVKNLDDETAQSLCIKYGKKRIQQYIMDIKRTENKEI